MSELLHLDLQGQTLEEIIMHPTLWAKRIEVAAQKGTDALSDLRQHLQQIDSPVARARECQTLILLDNPEQAAEVIEGETHCLCTAMHLAVKIYYGTLANYLYIIEQPEILTLGRSDLEQESQMRWDFMRAQSFQRVGHSNEALHCHTLAHRIAVSFDINSIVQVSKAQMRSLTPSPVSHKIDALLLQLDEVKKTKDFRINDYILENLCILYLLSNDYTSLQKYALELPPGILRDHIILLTNFFLNQRGSATLHPLGHTRNQPFCGAGLLLSVFNEFKSRIYIFKDHPDFQDKLEPVLDAQIPDNFDIPILNFIMWPVKVMAHTAAKDTD